MIEHWGWRSATLPVFLGAALIALLCLLFVRDRPAGIGLLLYGQVPTVAGVLPPKPALLMTWRTPFVTLREVSSNRTFWTSKAPASFAG